MHESARANSSDQHSAAIARVYVDDVRIPWRGKRWSHLTADTEEALHEFAAQIGLKREWFQPSSTRPEAHSYDVTDAKRDEAILAGAIPETWREGIARRRAAGEARGGPRSGCRTPDA